MRYPRKHGSMSASSMMHRLSHHRSTIHSHRRLLQFPPVAHTPTPSIRTKTSFARQRITLPQRAVDHTTSYNNDRYPFRSISSTTTDVTASSSLERQTQERSEEQESAPLPSRPPLPTDQDVQNFVDKLSAINPKTVYDDVTVEQVLEESWELLQKRLEENSPSATPLIQSMQQLLDLWFQMHFQSQSMPTRTNRPFRILLEAWSMVSFKNDPSAAAAGSNACQVLQRWYELLGGDLGLAPTMAEFNQVLAAYAATSTNLVQQLQQPHEEETFLLAEVTEEAWNVVQELKKWGYTMEPTLETNAHLIRCLSNNILSLQGDASDTWDRLNQVMKDAVMPVADKYRKESKTKAGIIFDTRQRDDPKELFYLLQTICDALVAAKRYLSSGRGVDSSSAEVCQAWGNFLSDALLQEPERMASVLDYGGANRLPYSCHAETQGDSLPSAFSLIVEGGEAWQFLLHHFYSHPEKNTAYQVNEILERLEELGQRYADVHRNDVYYAILKSYLLTIEDLEEAIPRLQDTEEREKASLILDNLLQRLQDQHFEFVDSESDSKRLTDSWNALMSAKFHEGKVDDVHKLWKDMRAHKLLGDSTSYAIVLKALADTTQPHAAPAAHRIWKKLISTYHRKSSSPTTPIPTARHYASVIVAWSRSPHPDAAGKAMEVFHQLERDYESQLNQIERDGMTSAVGSRASLKPNPVHYSALLTALTRSIERDKGNLEALQTNMLHLIERMLALPEAYSNNIAYGTALRALGKIGTQEAALIAQRILDDMEQKWKQGHNELKPTAFCYSDCMFAWSRAAEKGEVKDAYIQVEGLLRRLEYEFMESGKDPSLLPNEAVYSAILNAVIASGKADIASRAEEILCDMEEKATAGLATYPNDFVYCKVIAAYKRSAQSEDGERAEAILKRMAKAYHEKGITAAKPTSYAYSGVIQAWSRSPRPDKAICAQHLLREMQDAFKMGDAEIKPNRAAYVAVLSSCAYTPLDADAEHRQNAIRIALQTMVDLEVHKEESTEFMYHLTLTAICKHSSDLERKRLVSVLFQKCCEEGLVGKSVLAALRRYYPTFYNRLPGAGKSVEALPTPWTRNVIQDKKNTA